MVRSHIQVSDHINIIELKIPRAGRSASLGGELYKWMIRHVYGQNDDQVHLHNKLDFNKVLAGDGDYPPSTLSKLLKSVAIFST